MTTQVFLASTAFGLATVAAALDDGAFEPAERRVLVLSNNAAVPETAVAISEVAGIEGLLQRFDAVHDYNAVLAPQHPSHWQPRTGDLPLLERFLAREWSLTGDLQLVVDCVWIAPALSLCRIFPDARIDAYADGLMSYGPTRSAVPSLVASRIERLLHLDLVPGLSPVLLSEFGVPSRVISTDAFRKVVATLEATPAVVAEAKPGSVAVLLGQYLSALSILTPEEETELHLEMVRSAASAGFDPIVFKPHPGAPPLHAAPLLAEARRLGCTLTVVDDPSLVEGWFRSPSIGGVIGCFSTGLMTAASCYSLPTGRVGTELVMERLRPYQNSNRIPLTVVDALLPAGGQVDRAPVSSLPAGVELGALVRAVSYCMQPRRYPGLRSDAESLLAAHWLEVRRYFKRRRLTVLELPGGLEGRAATLRSGLRAAARRTLGMQIRRRLRQVLRRPRDATSVSPPG